MTGADDRESAAIVLVVEDEPLQRMDLLDMVSAAGFIAVEATDADHAVAILEARSDIRIVFTDVDMPGSMDGLRLAACVRDRWPPIKIIVTTAGLRPGADRLPADSMFLPKPLVAHDVNRALRSLAK